MKIWLSLIVMMMLMNVASASEIMSTLTYETYAVRPSTQEVKIRVREVSWIEMIIHKLFSILFAVTPDPAKQGDTVTWSEGFTVDCSAKDCYNPMLPFESSWICTFKDPSGVEKSSETVTECCDCSVIVDCSYTIPADAPTGEWSLHYLGYFSSDISCTLETGTEYFTVEPAVTTTTTVPGTTTTPGTTTIPTTTTTIPPPCPTVNGVDEFCYAVFATTVKNVGDVDVDVSIDDATPVELSMAYATGSHTLSPNSEVTWKSDPVAMEDFVTWSQPVKFWVLIEGAYDDKRIYAESSTDLNIYRELLPSGAVCTYDWECSSGLCI